MWKDNQDTFQAFLFSSMVPMFTLELLGFATVTPKTWHPQPGLWAAFLLWYGMSGSGNISDMWSSANRVPPPALPMFESFVSMLLEDFSWRAQLPVQVATELVAWAPQRYSSSCRPFPARAIQAIYDFLLPEPLDKVY
jgi:hypothetical protein